MLTDERKIAVVKDYLARLKNGQPEKYCIECDHDYVTFYNSFYSRLMNNCVKGIKLVDNCNNGVRHIDQAVAAQFKIKAFQSAVGRELLFNWRLA